MLQQELHWRAGYEGKNETPREYENEMIRTFAGTRFLVPFKGDGGFEAGGSMSFASLTGADGLRKLYAAERVPLNPAGERFLNQFAYLFSTMSPVQGNIDQR